MEGCWYILVGRRGLYWLLFLFWGTLISGSLLHMEDPYRHIRVNLKVRFRATHDVKFRFKRPGIIEWPFNSKSGVGQYISNLECDNCVIHVAAQDIPSLLATMEEDPSLRALVNLFFNFRLNIREEEEWPDNWQSTGELYVNNSVLWENFIHCGAAGIDCDDARRYWVEEQYHFWKNEEDFERYSEWELDGAAVTDPPKRRIVDYQCVAEEEEILPPWQLVDARSRGYRANGVFYPHSPVVEALGAELVGFAVITEGDDFWGEGTSLSMEQLKAISQT